MKRSSTIFLKTVIILIAIGVLSGIVWFPRTEGRAANLDLVSIYTDPFIIYLYIASIPFFTALCQAYKLLGYVDRNKIFSRAAVHAVKNIKYCAIAIIGFITGALFYIRQTAQGDDSAGPTMIGFIIIFTSVVITTAAGIFQKLLQHAVDLKSENDLTV